MKTFIIFCLLLFTFCLQNGLAVETWFKGYRFETKVITHKFGYLREYIKGSKPFIKVHEGDEYSILIKNPLPVPVGVVVSVDGLNVIDGKRETPAKSTKWLLKPYRSMSIRGWQTGKKALRRFYFTKKRHSYAKWKERVDHRKYTQNLGVIGVAYFWDSKALAYALNPPKPFAEEESDSEVQSFRRYKKDSHSKVKASKQAGTGMGRLVYNRVKRVNFHFDTGMYSTENVLKIFYEFDKYNEPKPFVDDNEGFAPEMNRIIRKVFGKGKWDCGMNTDNKPDINILKDHPYLKMARKNVLLARMRQIQTILHIYYAENNKFPESLNSLIHKGYISTLPDPMAGEWLYRYNTGKITHSAISNP